MKIHEYQAKELLRAYGIPAQGGEVVTSAAEAVEVSQRLGFPVVLKAQVHAGGRGKAGGVKVVREAAHVEIEASRILGLTIKGLPVHKLLMAPAADIVKEVYLSILVDRGARTVVFVGCAEGGVDIEETAQVAPEKILRYTCRAARLHALAKSHVLPFASRLFSEPPQAEATAEIMVRMAKLFAKEDCSLIEINPLVQTAGGEVLALDAKVILDDNALARHPAHADFSDPDSGEADELSAKAEGLSFIRLNGEIGCMVNGAGLAMATMDTIKHFGGEPANFLDVGGSSDPKKVVAAFKMILKDPSVKVILINIFGGITRCDDIARGILQSLESLSVRVPIVIRLIGTNEAEGRALLEGSPLIPVKTLEEGAQKAAEIARAA